MMYLVKKKPPIKPKKIKVPKNKTASANATKGDGNSTIDDTTSTEEPVVDEVGLNTFDLTRHLFGNGE
jgi:hypothetical protein